MCRSNTGAVTMPTPEEERIIQDRIAVAVREAERATERRTRIADKLQTIGADLVTIVANLKAQAEINSKYKVEKREMELRLKAVEELNETLIEKVESLERNSGVFGMAKSGGVGVGGGGIGAAIWEFIRSMSG
jgi:hypothetical protein